MSNNQKKHVFTLRNVAEKANVSLGCASAVLRNDRKSSIRVGKETAERVRRIAAEFGYRPSSASRAMSSQRALQIGVLLPNRIHHEATAPMNFETILGMNEGLQSEGYILSVIRLHDILDASARGSRVFDENALDGMIVLDAMPPGTEKWLRKQFEYIVWCDTNVWTRTTCVRRDEAKAGRLAAERLVKNGHDHIVWLSTPRKKPEHYSRAERLSGVREVATVHGVDLLEVTVDADSAAKVADLLPEGCGAVAESHPVAEFAALSAMRSNRLPGVHFSLVGCDDPHYISWRWRWLSRVEFNRFEMGRTAASMMLEMLGSNAPDLPVSIRLDCRWIERNSLTT